MELLLEPLGDPPRQVVRFQVGHLSRIHHHPNLTSGLHGEHTLDSLISGRQFLDPLEAIPLHGAVQLVSNGSRSWIQRAHVERGIVWRYALPLLPMGFLGLLLAQSLSPPVARALIGAFVLMATWAPGLLLVGAHPERSDRNQRFFALGTVVGFVNITVGATGPLIAVHDAAAGATRLPAVREAALVECARRPEPPGSGHGPAGAFGPGQGVGMSDPP